MLDMQLCPGVGVVGGVRKGFLGVTQEGPRRAKEGTLTAAGRRATRRVCWLLSRGLGSWAVGRVLSWPPLPALGKGWVQLPGSTARGEDQAPLAPRSWGFITPSASLHVWAGTGTSETMMAGPASGGSQPGVGGDVHEQTATQESEEPIIV